MELEKVSIKNFKGIEYKELELKPGINIIKGENGTGKTSILEAVASGLSLNFMSVQYEEHKSISGRIIARNDRRCIYKKMGDGGFSPYYSYPLEIECDVKNEDYCYQLILNRTSENFDRKNTSNREEGTLSLIANSEDKQLPVLIYEEASRRVFTGSKLKMKDEMDGSFERLDGYYRCMASIIDNVRILKWCARMEQISWQKEMKISEYEAVKSAVADFMDRMESDKNQKGSLYYDKQTDEILYCTGKKALPITSLSSGYQSLIWLVFDIAYRMAVLNPFMKSDIAKTDGVVLIDEIDLHLHPKWQWNVLNALHAVFPKVQFIVTTHSPIIIASTKRSWIIDIEKDEPEYGYSHYGLDINDTLKVCQDSQAIPNSVGEKVDKFYGYIDDEDLVQAGKILEDLEKEIGTNIPVVVEARVCYELEQMNRE